MKRSVYTIATAAIIFSACTKDVSSDLPSGKTFTGTLDNITKTELTRTNNVKWLPGDNIAIFDGTSVVKAAASAIRSEGLQADFTAAVADAEEYVAAYPFTGNTKVVDGKLFMEIPQYQDAVAGSFSTNVNPAISKTTAAEGSFKFKNIAGLVKFDVNIADVSQIIFAGNNNETFLHRFNVDYSGSEPVFSTTSTESRTWANYFLQGNITPGNTYFLAVSPKELTKGFKLTIKKKDGASFEIKSTTPLNIEANHIYYLGSINANTGYIFEGTAGTTASRALVQVYEDENIYAFNSELKAGNYYIKTAAGGIFPQSGHSINDEIPTSYTEGVVEMAGSEYWTIPSDGKYRIVLNLTAKTVTIYSEANDLQPKTINWNPNANASLPVVATTVRNYIYLRGAAAGWNPAGKRLVVVPSPADPQILYYSGAAMSGRNSFAISNSEILAGITYNVNNSFVFSPEKNDDGKDSATIVHGTWAKLAGGAGAERGYYWNLPAGTNFIILDIRNMRIYTAQK